MARVSPVAHGELIRRLRKFGFSGPWLAESISI